MPVAGFNSRLHTAKGNLKLWTKHFACNVTNEHGNNLFVSGPTNNAQTNTSVPASTAGVTMANFNRLQKGMTYAQAVQILGKEGKEEGVLGSGAEKIVMYRWDADEDGSGATMSAFFKNGKLDTKFQFGLK